VDRRPLFRKKPSTLDLQQQIACAGIDEHADTSPLLDKSIVGQLLVALQNREWIDPIFGRHSAHRWQRIAFIEHPVQYHCNDSVAKLRQETDRRIDAADALAIAVTHAHHRQSVVLRVAAAPKVAVR